MTEPLRLAVVGHTNTGKTSLLRTLTRDPHFGDVADRPSTTRHVEGAALQVDGEPLVALFDTPGLESAGHLLDYLEHLQLHDGRRDGPDQIDRVLATPAAAGEYEQEAKVLRQLRQSDAALYVIDAREAVLGKYRDELEILNLCGKPLLPVLNFVAQPPHRASDWRQALARLGLHVVVEFDSVAPALDGEQQLYDRLGTLLEGEAALLARLAEDRRQQRQVRHQTALTLVANLLVDVAALRRGAPRERVDAVAAELRDQVRRHEAAAIAELLSLYSFDPDTVERTDLPPSAPRLDLDLFHPEVVKEMGMQLGVGVASGAAAGAAVDLFTGGLSLGVGTVVGATVGGLWQSAESFGQRLLGRVRGWQEITVDDAILGVLALRLRRLLQALEERGHASQQRVRLETGDAFEAILRKGRLPEVLREARGQPHWSRLDPGFEDSRRRQALVARLAVELEEASGTPMLPSANEPLA